MTIKFLNLFSYIYSKYKDVMKSTDVCFRAYVTIYKENIKRNFM